MIARGDRTVAKRELDRLVALTRPSLADIALVHRNAFTWSLLGLAHRGAALTERWLELAPREGSLRLAHATFAMHVTEEGASEEPLHVSEPAEAALASRSAIMRGGLRRGVSLARNHAWFLGLADEGVAVTYVIWALSELGEVIQARALLEEWVTVRANPSALERTSQLRTRAFLASLEPRAEAAIAALEESMAVAARARLQLEEKYGEAELAVAYAHEGRIEDAERLLDRWGKPRRATSPVDAYRELARACVFSLSGDSGAAWRAALRVVEYALRTGNAITETQGRFYAALSAPQSRVGEAFTEYRRMVRVLPSVRQIPRCQVIARASGHGERSLRGCALRETQRERTRTLPVGRLWMPDRESLSADVYYDRVQRRLHLRGEGPFDLPVDAQVSRIIDLLLTAEGFSLEQERLVEQMWPGEYHRLRDASKLHVSLHRLRGWLDARLAGSRSMLHVGDRSIVIDPRLEVRVVDLPALTLTRATEAPDLTRLERRMIDLVEICGPVATADLMRHLDVGRSTLATMLGPLVKRELLRRAGRGRATTYAVP